MIEIAPAALLRPNRVPCGPLRTSMRSMSLKASHRRAGARRVDAIDVHAHRRIGADTEVAGLDAANLVTRLRRAVARHHQARHEAVQVTHVFCRDVRIRALSTTCMAIGTSCSDCERSCAVTMISSNFLRLALSCARAMPGTTAASAAPPEPCAPRKPACFCDNSFDRLSGISIGHFEHVLRHRKTRLGIEIVLRRHFWIVVALLRRASR